MSDHDGLIQQAQDEEQDEGLTNEQFRQLALDSQLAGDPAAGQELTTYLLSKIRRMVRTFPLNDREDAVWHLMLAGSRAAKATVTSVSYIEKPRNYTMRAMTNEFISLHRKAANDRSHGELLWDYTESPQVDAAACLPLRAVENRLLIIRFQEESSTVQDKRVAEVLLVSYLDHCSLREACGALSYSKTETVATLKKIQRDRNSPGTRLFNLIQDLRADNQSEL